MSLGHQHSSTSFYQDWIWTEWKWGKERWQISHEDINTSLQKHNWRYRHSKMGQNHRYLIICVQKCNSWFHRKKDCPNSCSCLLLCLLDCWHLLLQWHYQDILDIETAVATLRLSRHIRHRNIWCFSDIIKTY